MTRAPASPPTPTATTDPQAHEQRIAEQATPAPRIIPWAEIRSTYEGSKLPVSVIAQAYAIRDRQIYDRAARDNWQPRRLRAHAPQLESTPLDRSVLVARLFQAVERQIAEIERRFGNLARTGADEKDARTLAALARTIELLLGLERQAKPDSPEAPEADIDEIRRDLARRITNMQRAGPD